MRMRPLNRYHFLILMLSTTSLATAQFERFYENWRWSQFTTASGLPSNYIENIIETKEGTPWVATPNGIAWYDGYRWTETIVDGTISEKNVRSIEPFTGKKIFVILANNLYVGDQYGFDKVTISLFNQSGKVTSVCGIDSKSFLCVYELKDTTVLLRISGSHISKEISPAAGKIFRAGNTIWLQGASQFALNTIYRRTPSGYSRASKKISYNLAIRDIVENDSGMGAIALDAPKQNIGIWEYNVNGTPMYSLSERNQPIRSISISNSGDIISAYESGDVHIRANNIWNNLHPVPKQLINTLSILYRKNGDIWVCTEDGLYLFRMHEELWSDRGNSFSDLKNVVMEIYRSRNGDLWVGTMNGVEIHKTNGAVEYISSILGSEIGLVTGICEDGAGNIWISTGAGFHGTYQWNGKKWKRYLASSGICFHKIRRDSKGRLWFLGLGVAPGDPPGYCLENGKFLRIDSLYDVQFNRIYAFGEGKNGVLWFGTNQGLVRIKNGELKQWGRSTLGKNNKIFTLAIDNSDNTWFSTFSPELAKIGTNDSIEWVWRADDLHNYRQKVWDINVDREGILWVATTKGLFRYCNETWTNYSYEKGLNIRELRVVSSYDSIIYIGGHGIGLRSIKKERHFAPIHIYMSKPIIEENIAHCSWNAFSFWGVYPSESIETRYRLDSGDWSEWGERNSIVLERLSSGNHDLDVQAKDKYGNIQTSEGNSTFYIELPVYLRSYIAGPFLAMIGIILYFIYRYKKAVKIHKKALEDQRTRIANDLHDEVGSNLGSLSLLSQKLERVQGLPARVARDLKIISQTSLQTSDYLREIVWYINPRYDSFMNLEARMREIIGKMLQDYTLKVEMENQAGAEVTMLESRRNIILMFKEIIHNIIKHSRASAVEITCIRRTRYFFLRVKDNGVGFEQDEIRNGNGLLSLKRRAEDIGSQLSISSHRGEGTEIIVVFSGTTTDL